MGHQSRDELKLSMLATMQSLERGHLVL